MHFIPIERLIVSKARQRQAFNPEAEVELAASIGKVGLINPLLVRFTDGSPYLVAGERRLKAIRKLEMLGKRFSCNGQLVPLGEAPCLDLGSPDEIMAFEAELDENIRRLDLSWQERALALKRLYELRTALDPQYKVLNLLAEAKVTSNTKARDFTLADNLHDPDVARARTADDAYKIVLKKDAEARNELHAAMVGKEFSSAQHTLLLGDALRVLPDLPSESFDVILTDPPYGIDADQFGDAAGKLLTIDHQYRDTAEGFYTLMEAAAKEMTRVAKPAAHLYVCCDLDKFHWLRDLFERWEWSVFRTPLINFKQGSGRVPLPEHGPRRCWEPILYAYRGGRKCTAIYSDVILSTAEGNLGHGAQKPVGLFIDLLRRSVRAGDSVLDPFAGTGTIFEAAHEFKCRATGIELEAKYFGIAAKRIEGLK